MRTELRKATMFLKSLSVARHSKVGMCVLRAGSVIGREIRRAQVGWMVLVGVEACDQGTTFQVWFLSIPGGSY